MHDAFPRVGPHVPVYDVTWTEAQQRIRYNVDLDDALDQPNLRLRGGAHEDADEKKSQADDDDAASVARRTTSMFRQRPRRAQRDVQRARQAMGGVRAQVPRRRRGGSQSQSRSPSLGPQRHRPPPPRPRRARSPASQALRAMQPRVASQSQQSQRDVQRARQEADRLRAQADREAERERQAHLDIEREALRQRALAPRPGDQFADAMNPNRMPSAGPMDEPDADAHYYDFFFERSRRRGGCRWV